MKTIIFTLISLLVPQLVFSQVLGEFENWTNIKMLRQVAAAEAPYEQEPYLNSDAHSGSYASKFTFLLTLGRDKKWSHVNYSAFPRYDYKVDSVSFWFKSIKNGSLEPLMFIALYDKKGNRRNIQKQLVSSASWQNVKMAIPSASGDSIPWYMRISFFSGATIDLTESNSDNIMFVDDVQVKSNGSWTVFPGGDFEDVRQDSVLLPEGFTANRYVSDSSQVFRSGKSFKGNYAVKLYKYINPQNNYIISSDMESEYLPIYQNKPTEFHFDVKTENPSKVTDTLSFGCYIYNRKKEIIGSSILSGGVFDRTAPYSHANIPIEYSKSDTPVYYRWFFGGGINTSPSAVYFDNVRFNSFWGLSIVDPNIDAIVVFPNPVVSKLFLKDVEFADIEQVRIVATSGAILKVLKKTNLVSGIDVSDLTPGRYLIQIDKCHEKMPSYLLFDKI